MESHCLFRDGFSSLIKNISKIRQSNLLWKIRDEIRDEIKVRENKPPLVNQQCVVYNFQCNLCDAGYVGYMCRHLHLRIEEHKGSAIGSHLKEQHDIAPDDIAQFFKIFKILKKCQSKFDCLIFEMFFIKELKPSLNKQCDSIRAKLFV